MTGHMFDAWQEFAYTKGRRRGVAQLVARIVWDDEVGSSSLPTPTR